MSLFSPPDLYWVLAIIAVAAFAHGMVGVGFPIISTPLLAAMTDLKTAILLTVLPNIAVNLFGILKGGNWQHSLGRHWHIAVYVLIGSIIGTHLLIGLPANPLKLMLAIMILIYLNLSRLKTLDWGWLQRFPKLAEGVFGISAGVLSGTVNVAVPPLVIYFVALGLAPVAMIQILNLCFIVGKGTQLATLSLSGAFGMTLLWPTLSLAMMSLAFQLIGMRVQNRMPRETYQKWLNITLLLMAIILIAQVTRAWLVG